MAELLLPFLGGGMESATVVEWLVSPGQRVRKGDVVAVVDTFKGAIEIEVFEEGVVDAILVEAGDKVAVGAPLARITAAPTAELPTVAPHATAPPTVAPPATSPPARAASPNVSPPAAVSRPAPISDAPAPAELSSRPPARVRATPVARRRAEELGIDLTSVRPTGDSGVVVLADVEHAAAERASGGPSSKSSQLALPHPPRVSPLARRAAETLGVPLEGVTGTGAGGAVTRADVERAAAQRGVSPVSLEAGGVTLGEAAPAEGPREAAPPVRPLRSEEMRRAIANATARAKREIPHYYLSTPVDMSHALAWLAARNAELPLERRLLPAALLLRAVALALAEVPELNGFWIDDAFRPGAGVHLGMAISLRGGGLLAPAIHDADRKSVFEVMDDLRDLVGRARTGMLRGSELADPTITVTELGDRGVDTVFGIINPPQVALVGFGKIQERPWAEGGLVGARPVVTASLSADHRVSDGHRGGIFLSALADLLTRPDDL